MPNNVFNFSLTTIQVFLNCHPGLRVGTKLNISLLKIIRAVGLLEILITNFLFFVPRPGVEARMTHSGVGI